MWVKLLANGQFVCNVQIPPFIQLPEMIQWGSRTFVLNKQTDDYEEGMLWHVTSDSLVTFNQ